MNLVISSNLADKSGEHTEKTVFERIYASCPKTVTVFAGIMLLSSTVNGNTVIQQPIPTEDSFAQCVNIEKYDNALNNYTVDLVKAENLNKIRKMALFKDDWNGTGGKAFAPSTISFFEEVIQSLRKQPQIAPTGRNSLLMQYELDNKSLLAFEVNENRTEKVYVPNGDYSLAQTEMIKDNIAEQIKESVENFFRFE